MSPAAALGRPLCMCHFQARVPLLHSSRRRNPHDHGPVRLWARTGHVRSQRNDHQPHWSPQTTILPLFHPFRASPPPHMDVPHDAADFKPLDVTGYRKPYYNSAQPYFLEHSAADDPYLQFHTWFSNVCDQKDVSYEEMNAVSLSTCVNNKPSSRMVLMKKYDRNGFCFFTNAISRKGKELAKNPNAAMLFYWPFVNRQIRIEGVCEFLSQEEVDEYWQSRPANSRIGGMISDQSHIIPSRKHLEDKRAHIEQRVRELGEEKVLVKPPSWTGYRLKPNYFEFWQGQSDRIHDRIAFRQSETDPAAWTRQRLAP